MHSPLVVLGGGPGGYAAAFLAADEGLEVTLVEGESRLGGTCLLRGCIPSKALLHVARVISEAEELSHDWGVSFGPPQIALEQLRARKEKVISTLSGGLKQLAKRRKVTVIHARGVFENSTTLQLDGDHASIPDERQLTFDHLILATGSTPAMPPSLSLDSPRVMGLFHSGAGERTAEVRGHEQLLARLVPGDVVGVRDLSYAEELARSA